MKRLEDLEYFLTSILVHQCPFGGAVSPPVRRIFRMPKRKEAGQTIYFLKRH